MHLKDGTLLQSGKYKILKVLGQGGFGITYLAMHAMTEELFAIKEFFPKTYCTRDDATSQITLGTSTNQELLNKLLRRFKKEAENLKSLNHDGIVKVSDIFSENNTAYFAMDYIEGASLSNIIKTKGALKETQAIEYVSRIGDALSYLHSRNMTHFDVKPGNIMIRNSDGRPILIDFGLSVQYTEEGDETSTNLGAASPGYSAIEMYDVTKLRTFSPQTDVYSLAATLYYLITGVQPPKATDIIMSGLNLPETINTQVAAALRNAMNVRPKDRTSSVTDFINELKNRDNTSEDTVIIPEIVSKPATINTNFKTEESLKDPKLSFPLTYSKFRISESRYYSPKAVSQTSSPGVITYESSNPACVWVDKNTGNVEIYEIGRAIITARIAATEKFKAGTASYEAKVDRRRLDPFEILGICVFIFMMLILCFYNILFR